MPSRCCSAALAFALLSASALACALARDSFRSRSASRSLCAFLIAGAFAMS